MSEEDVYIAISDQMYVVDETPLERALIVLTVLGTLGLGAAFGGVVYVLENLFN
jgi:hypothetical protein